jgi:hypothetical protein
MGQIGSAPSNQERIVSCLKFMMGEVSYPLEVDRTLVLRVDKSTLPSLFISERANGLFCTSDIKEGTVIMKVRPTSPCIMNDGMVDLNEILLAQTSMAMYNAWWNLYLSYYNVDHAVVRVNVKMVRDSNHTVYYHAMKDIPIGTELVRMYGFTTWIMELFDIMTNKTIVGFARFVDEFSRDLVGDPYVEKIHALREALIKLGINNIFTLDLREYDTTMESVTSINMEYQLKRAFHE